jgi:hypothetical protein
MQDLNHYFGGIKNVLYRNRVPADMGLILQLYQCDLARAADYLACGDNAAVQYNSVLFEACIEPIIKEEMSFCDLDEICDNTVMIEKMRQALLLEHPKLTPIYSSFTHETTISIPLYPYRKRVNCTAHKLTAYQWRTQVKEKPVFANYVTLIEEKTCLTMKWDSDDKKMTEAFLSGELPLADFTAYTKLKEKIKTGNFAA